jgi:UDP-2-acetamido-2-deoxy-ribo-hexuluronate aminotransferase
MKNIQMVDLKTQYEKIKDKVDQAISEVINETSFINGAQVKLFAEELAAHNQVKHVIPCANGTDALQIAMMALDFKPGDEVIVPAFTYVATVEVIALLGLKPVFVDVDPDTFNLSISEIEKKVTSRTVAIVPVHLYGQCADMEGVLNIAKEHNLYVIEDTAQAIGSRYTFSDGTVQMAGTIGHIGTTSFFPSKNLGCYGDGGALFTNDDQLAHKMQVIANHGQQVKYYHDSIGVNSRLDTIQAAILRVKLPHLNRYSKSRQEVADFYDKELGSINELQVPVRASNSTHVFHQYTLKVVDGDRDKLKDFLQSKGIPSMIYYPVPLHLQKAYIGYGYKQGDYSVSEYLSSIVLSLPIHTEMDEEQLVYITKAVKEYFNS